MARYIYYIDSQGLTLLYKVYYIKSESLASNMYYMKSSTGLREYATRDHVLDIVCVSGAVHMLLCGLVLRFSVGFSLGS